MKYMPELVNAYMTGSEQPSEIVVFLSGATERRTHCEGVSLTSEKKVVYAGEARQRALDLCSGDVVVYNDADDLPHPDRIKIVREMFDNNDIVHLAHSFIFMNKEQYPVKIENVKFCGGEEICNRYFPHGKFEDCRSISTAYGDLMARITAGACCVKRNVLKEVQWPNIVNGIEDYLFCMEVAFRYRKSMLIDAPLYSYRK
jgi:cellulose synthase/poly-beta-1,6-N-acetylglucosamine synthase-like glycosyltransferase